jgi:hypothetical protein
MATIQSIFAGRTAALRTARKVRRQLQCNSAVEVFIRWSAHAASAGNFRRPRGCRRLPG